MGPSLDAAAGPMGCRGTESDDFTGHAFMARIALLPMAGGRGWIDKFWSGDWRHRPSRACLSCMDVRP